VISDWRLRIVDWIMEEDGTPDLRIGGWRRYDDYNCPALSTHIDRVNLNIVATVFIWPALKSGVE
jgi:hypothetical protein